VGRQGKFRKICRALARSSARNAQGTHPFRALVQISLNLVGFQAERRAGDNSIPAALCSLLALGNVRFQVSYFSINKGFIVIQTPFFLLAQ
jgi:hypothetical protein